MFLPSTTEPKLDLHPNMYQGDCESGFPIPFDVGSGMDAIAAGAAQDALCFTDVDNQPGVMDLVNLTEVDGFKTPQMLETSPLHCGGDCLYSNNMTSYLLRTSTFDDICHGGLSANAFNSSTLNVVEAWIRPELAARIGIDGSSFV